MSKLLIRSAVFKSFTCQVIDSAFKPVLEKYVLDVSIDNLLLSKVSICISDTFFDSDKKPSMFVTSLRSAQDRSTLP